MDSQLLRQWIHRQTARHIQTVCGQCVMDRQVCRQWIHRQIARHTNRQYADSVLWTGRYLDNGFIDRLPDTQTDSMQTVCYGQADT